MIYRYQVEFFDGTDETESKLSVGFCEANNYIEAVHKLIDFFGEINIIAFKNLKLIGDHNIIELASDREGADDLEQAEHVLDEYEKNFIW